MDTELTTRLRGLMAKATVTPWDIRGPIITAKAGYICRTDTDWDEPEDIPRVEANALLIRESANALPTLLDALEAQGRDLAAMTARVAELERDAASFAKLLGAVTMELMQEHWWDARELVQGLPIGFPDGEPVVAAIDAAGRK